MSIVKSFPTLNGITLPHLKNTKDNQTIEIKTPDKLMIPMQQHMGVSCEPIVKKGDVVCVATKIGASEHQFSVPIHSSCSGTVVDIIDYTSALSNVCKAVVIESDGLDTLDSSITKPNINNKDEFIKSIKESGIVGLGGAGFPTFMKFDYKGPSKLEKLVINFAECEPYITADYRESIENTDNIVKGIRAVKKYLDIKEVFIGIEDNKPKSIEILNNAFDKDDNVSIVKLKSIYPQGAEKSIIYSTCGIKLKKGKLPADFGIIVLNISTVGFIGGYLEDGIPLIKKRITIDGDIVSNPTNLMVPIGTSIQNIIDICDIDVEKSSKILFGGPMMGMPSMSINEPIIKNNNALIFLSDDLAKEQKTTECIRCGKCIEVCPINLMPANLERAYDAQDIETLKELHVDLCINCGCCSYVCPSKRHLAHKHQLAKNLLRNYKKGDTDSE